MSTWRRAGVTLKAFHFADWIALLLWIRRIHNVLRVHGLLVVGPFRYIIGILYEWNKDINRELRVNVYMADVGHFCTFQQLNLMDRKNISVWAKYNSESKKESFLSERNQYWLWFAHLSRFRQAGEYKTTFTSSACFAKLRQTITITLNIRWI